MFGPLVLFCCLDLSIRFLFRNRLPAHPQSCYYLLHSFFNLYICYLSFPSLWYSLTNHDLFYLQDYTEIGTLIGLFHLYHTINYFDHLDSEDVIHHLMSWIVCYFGVEHRVGGGSNIIAFFMCGCPGIGYYLPLFLSLKGYISRYRQKKVNLYSNFIRCVGIIYGVSVTLFNWAEGKIPLTNVFFATFLSVLCVWNATYFFYIVISDYVRNSKRLD